MSVKVLCGNVDRPYTNNSLINLNKFISRSVGLGTVEVPFYMTRNGLQLENFHLQSI